MFLLVLLQVLLLKYIFVHCVHKPCNCDENKAKSCSRVSSPVTTQTIKKLEWPKVQRTTLISITFATILFYYNLF